MWSIVIDIMKTNYNAKNLNRKFNELNKGKREKTMELFVIKRSDGKYYSGKGGKTFRGDPSWKNEIHSATIYKEVYLAKALSNVKCKLKDTDFSFEVVKIKIDEEKDDKERSSLNCRTWKS